MKEAEYFPHQIDVECSILIATITGVEENLKTSEIDIPYEGYVWLPPEDYVTITGLSFMQVIKTLSYLILA